MFEASASGATTGGESTGGDEVPSAGAPAGVTLAALGTLLAIPRRSLLEDAAAVFKSIEIMFSGVRVWNAAAYAVVLTSLEDASAQYRARRSCRTTGALLAVERDHALRFVQETARRGGLLARIARDIGEEALYPLRNRIGQVLENLRWARVR